MHWRRLRGIILERGLYFAVSDSLMHCLLWADSASIILEEQRSNVLGSAKTSTLAPRTSTEVIYQNHAVAATLRPDDL